MYRRVDGVYPYIINLLRSQPNAGLVRPFTKRNKPLGCYIKNCGSRDFDTMTHDGGIVGSDVVLIVNKFIMLTTYPAPVDRYCHMERDARSHSVRDQLRCLVL